MKSIRRQLSLELLVACFFLQNAGMLAVYFVSRAGMVGEFDDALRAKALAVSTLITDSREGMHADMAALFLGAGDVVSYASSPSRAGSYQRFLEEFHRRARHNYFELWDASGKRLTRSATLGDIDLPRRVDQTDHPMIWNFQQPNGQPGRAVGFVFRPARVGALDPNAPPAPELQLVVATERRALDDKLMRLKLLTGGSELALLVVTLGLIARVLGRGLKPLNHLAENVALIDVDTLAARFPVAAAPVELHPIIDRVNRLLERLERSFEREHRFSADLAHELRTPLAELRGLAECSLKWPHTRDPSIDRDMLAIADQMDRLVEHMLALARGEQKNLPVRREAVDLEVIVRQVWRRFEARASQRGLRLTSRFEIASVEADRALMSSIITILIENAVDYSPPGSEIIVVCAGKGNSAVVRVQNAAAGLNRGDLEKLFDRFWRKETARSGGAHLGLGLSLARTYALAMGWRIDAELDADGQLSIVFSGPTVTNETCHQVVM